MSTSQLGHHSHTHLPTNSFPNAHSQGLIESLMATESTEIQKLKTEIRLLSAKNQYLSKDNQLLQN